LGDRTVSALRARDIGFVFQSFNLMNHLTARENVIEALAYAGTPARSQERMAEAALGEVGLDHRSAHYPPQLSGGERQRVAIARALATRPRLILADEPTGNLDRAAADSVLDLLCNVVDPTCTVVIVTHDPEVAGLMDRRIAMADGRIVSDSAHLVEAAEC
jgi:putative ABC transport system ATP-binding protein